MKILHVTRCLKPTTFLSLLGSRTTWSVQRTLYSASQDWPPEYNSTVRGDIEVHWKTRLREFDSQNGFKGGGVKENKYVLSMFPYPSGALHMGHVRVYVISDVMARYFRSKGYDVIHPMGWDAFGLPAENAAIDRGEQPQAWTLKNIGNMRSQLEDLGLSFDWDRELMTCDPVYYKWTQNLFLRMYKAGLVYQKQAPVNWDPVDQTVLADEQIDEEGKSWRSGAVAEKRLLNQWYIRATAYSKSLYDGLEKVDSSLWRDVVLLQKNWIGECDGLRLEFDIKGGKTEDKLSIFTRTPEGIHGASHILVSKDHPLIHHLEMKPSECHLLAEVMNSITGHLIPVFYSGEFDFGDHLDSHLGIPSLNTEDEEFAKKNNLEYNNILESQEDGTRVHINSQELSGLERSKAGQKLSLIAKKLGCGSRVTSERGRDWLISRQRYWGTPIPIIHCNTCGAVPVPKEDLPVVLPKLDKLTGKGISPLREADVWKRVKCPKCGGEGERETDTMDTFVDSSWYFLRYCDPHNLEEEFSPQSAQQIMPVDLYIGGKEHAIMHLYYARFFSHFLNDIGMISHREPFVNLLTQGMVMGQSYSVTQTGRYLPKDQVDFSGGAPVEIGTGADLTVEWEKMSKSKYNGTDPQAVVEKYGTDSTRLCILSNVAPKTDRNWDPKDMQGILRWQSRMWKLVTSLRNARHRTSQSKMADHETEKQWENILFEARNFTVKEVSHVLAAEFLLNVVISRFQSFTNTLMKVSPEVLNNSIEYELSVCSLVVMLSPFAPMFASELWAGLQPVCRGLHNFDMTRGVLEQKWPTNDAIYSINLKVKKQNHDCFEIPLPVTLGNEEQLSRDDFLQLAMTHPEYDECFGGLNTKRFNLQVIPGFKAHLIYKLNKKEEKQFKEKLRKERMAKKS